MLSERLEYIKGFFSSDDIQGRALRLQVVTSAPFLMLIPKYSNYKLHSTTTLDVMT
jgi:hypothetical protein